MSRFAEQFARFAAPALFGQHGETVTYKPHGGTPREIVVIVDRNPPERFDAAGNVLTPKMTIRAWNDATIGISSAAMNGHGADKIAVAHRIGGPVEDHPLVIPESGTWQEGGMLLLDLK